MLALLTSQTKTAKIPAGVPSGTATANKTGELADSGKLGVVENDIAIVFDKEHPYVLCVLSNNIKNNSSAQNTIKKISADVYTYNDHKTKVISHSNKKGTDLWIIPLPVPFPCISLFFILLSFLRFFFFHSGKTILISVISVVERTVHTADRRGGSTGLL